MLAQYVGISNTAEVLLKRGRRLEPRLGESVYSIEVTYFAL